VKRTSSASRAPSYGESSGPSNSSRHAYPLKSLKDALLVMAIFSASHSLSGGASSISSAVLPSSERRTPSRSSGKWRDVSSSLRTLLIGPTCMCPRSCYTLARPRGAQGRGARRWLAFCVLFFRYETRINEPSECERTAPRSLVLRTVTFRSCGVVRRPGVWHRHRF
jgi:hypothetical protein